ncbi:SDR family oxidoreductase [Nocardioides sp. NPDC051685]|uniref:SDR family oxidoreductase n=1 Tax=Nocardioides sp. NPDC051685 TaxID=3364334 RepID=UPI0037B044C3
MNVERMAGKVAIISGGAGGLGAAQARRFVEEGAKVVIADVHDDAGAELAAELGEAAQFVHLDVTIYAEWEHAIETAVNAFGGLDVLVNNAGIARWQPLEEHSFENWDLVIAVNLTGAFYGMKAAIEPLKRSGKSSIVNISSIAGIQGFEALPSYTASKFGVRGLTKSAALDLGKYGIRVNSVHPGRIETSITAGRDLKAMEKVALHRHGQANEVAELVLHLASDESSYSTGAEFIVDGGLTAGIARN